MTNSRDILLQLSKNEMKQEARYDPLTEQIEQDKILDVILIRMRYLRSIAELNGEQLSAQNRLLDKFAVHIDKTDNDVRKATQTVVRLKNQSSFSCSIL